MTEDRAQTIVRFFPLVRLLARRVTTMVPGADMDDLIGDGSIGLIRAVDTYNAVRGASLERYVRHIVTGAMLNGLRKRDPVSERARRTIREVERERFEIAQHRGEMPSVAEMERKRSSYARANLAVVRYTPLSLDAPLPPGTRLLDVGANPADVVVAQSEREHVALAIAALPARERRVIELHYRHEQPLRCVAETLAVSSQRASQLHLAALGRLRRARTNMKPLEISRPATAGG